MEAVKVKFYCFLGIQYIVHPTVYNTVGEPDYIALQYNDRIQIRSILCVFSTDEPCKDRLILTAKKTDKTN